MAWLATGGCSPREVQYGTDAYWRLSPQEREGQLRRYLHRQAERASRLRERCRRLGTPDGEMIARQFDLWASWVREAERDPVLGEHVLTSWMREYTRARKARHRTPRTVEEARAWVLSRQNPITGSFAPPEAPLWLAIGETAEALRLLADGDSLPDLRDPPLFLAILRSPEAAIDVTATTYELASVGGLLEPMRSLAWLPWLRWVTRRVVGWDPSWDRAYRAYCTRTLLDPATGMYRPNRTTGGDAVTTYRFARGWSRQTDLVTWLPSPQAMAPVLLAREDELLNPEDASLLVGCVADLDGATRAAVCERLGAMAQEAYAELVRAGPLRLRACDVLFRVGVGNPIVLEWLGQFGCRPPVSLDPSRVMELLRAGPFLSPLEELEAQKIVRLFPS